jgi:general secretion pathway protein N
MMGRWIFLRGGRLAARTKLILAGLFLLALIVMFPLRIALGLIDPGAHGVTARAVEGTIWSGRIGELRSGPLPLGTVEAGMYPLPLLIGRGEIWLRRPAANGAASFSANAAGGADWLRLSEVDGTVPLADGLGQLPVTTLGFSGFSYSSEAGRCKAAEGTVSLTLASLTPLLPNDVVFGGKARCDRGALYVPMTGPTGMEKLFVRLEANGTWRADLMLGGLPVEVTTPLLEQGFTGRNGGIGLSATGKL